jgi:hypothetical protein
VTSPIDQPSGNVVAGATDAAGNPSPTTTTPYTDTTAPTATSLITTITDDTGTADDFMTNDQTLVISGTNTVVGSGEIVKLSLDGGATWVNTTPTSSTAWSYDNTTNTLSEGTYTLETRVVDAAGNAGTVSSQIVTINLTGPISTSKIESITTDTGVSATDFTTNDPTLLIAGSNSTLAAGEIVQVSLDGGVTWSNVTPTSSTAWTFDNQGNTLADGAYEFQTRVIDSSENAGSVNSQTVTIDNSSTTEQPSGGTDPLTSNVIAVTAITDDTGVSSSDFTTADNTLVFSGTSDAIDGSNVSVKIDGVHVGYTTVTGGTWSYNYTTTTMADGSYNVSADLVDLAGNVAKSSAVQAVIIDGSSTTEQPSGGTDPLTSNVIAVTAITDDTGVSSSDFTTADNTLVFSGTSDAIDGSNVSVKIDGVHVPSATTTRPPPWLWATTPCNLTWLTWLATPSSPARHKPSPLIMVTQRLYLLLLVMSMIKVLSKARPQQQSLQMMLTLP